MIRWNEFTKGIIKENPVLILLLGLCPLLAVSATAINSLGMGIAVLFVLVGSNLVVSLFRKFIPDGVRIPVFIIIISTFVTVTDYLMAAYYPPLHKSLGVFVPLIVVNCIILGRAEVFAYRNNIFYSLLDALGMGLGFTLVITIIGMIRELLGSGTVFGLGNFVSYPALIMILPPGGFITIGFLIGVLNWYRQKYK
ncbi:electron transport complex subunit E [bacterium]|nr:electron transport complex subunit E [bacterium]